MTERFPVKKIPREVTRLSAGEKVVTRALSPIVDLMSCVRLRVTRQGFEIEKIFTLEKEGLDPEGCAHCSIKETCSILQTHRNILASEDDS